MNNSNQSKQFEQIEALLECAKAGLCKERFEETARSIFDTCRRMTGASAGFVELQHEDDSGNQAIFLEQGGAPGAAAPDLMVCIRGMSAAVYKSGQAAYENDYAKSAWMQGVAHAQLKNVLLAPLSVDGKIVGLMGMANKPGDFTDEDMRFAAAFGGFAALALQYGAAHRALRRSGQRLDELLQSVNDVVWSADKDGRLLFVNRAVEELYGVSAEQFQKNATLWLEAVHPGDRPIMERKARELLEGRNFVCEYRIVRPDATERWVQDRSSPVCDDQGALMRIVGITTDITLRKEAEMSLNRELAVNATLAMLGRELLDPETGPAKIAHSVLKHARSLTQSRHGFVSEIDPRTGDNVAYTLTSMVDQECAAQGENRRISFACNKDGAYPALWGHVLNTRQSLFTNDPDSHPQSTGTPAGHVPLHNFLSVPVVIANELLGQIALSNSSRAYTESDIFVIERLATIYALAIQRQRARQALLHSETKFRTLVTQAGDSIFLVGAQSRILDVNDTACAALGYTREELLTMSIPDIDSEYGLSKLEEMYRESHPGQTRAFESMHKRRDGTLFPVEVKTTVIRIEDELLRMSIARDITGRREQERERGLLEQRLKSLWRVARLVDADLKTLCTATLDELMAITQSPCGFYGFMNEDASVLNVHAWSKDCAVSGDMAAFPVHGAGVWAEAVREQRPVLINNMAPGAPGCGDFIKGHAPIKRLLVVPIIVKDKVSALAAVANKEDEYTPEDKEQVHAFAANVQIVIDKKRADEEMASLRGQLIQSQKMEAIGRMAGGLAHDFNNMLAVILGNASLALEDLEPDAPHYDELSEITAAAKRSRELILKLLTFTRNDKLNPRILPPAAILDDLLAMLRRGMPKNVVIYSDYHQKLDPITVDATQLQQALLNVCTNACDAMPAGGILTIGARNRSVSRNSAPGLAPGKYCEITITDTGHGIPQSIFDKIFDPFFTTKGVGQGTGLGLAISRGIITNHGGRISVNSGPGGGAQFRILLPSAERAAPRAAAPTRTRALSVQGGAETVLVVDDEPGVLDLAVKILSHAGYHVLSAANGRDAVDIVRNDPQAVDVMVLDIIMPGMDGEQVFHAVRAIRPDMRIILSSGYSRQGAAETMLKAGALAFTQKPYTMQELCGAVREVCDRDL